MNISLNDFNTNMISLKSSILILADNNSGKSTLVKDLIFNLNHVYPSGIACSSQQSFYTQFLNEKNVYNRYSNLLSTRSLFNYHYLILDNWFDKLKFSEILNKYNNSNHVLLIISNEFFYCDMNYNLIFINNLTDSDSLEKIYYTYIQYICNDLLSLEQFIILVQEFNEDFEFLVINCNSKHLNELFLTYTATLHDSFKSIDYYDK